MATILTWLRKWYFIPLLFFISALAYLPHIADFGYFRDDWYLMYSANALGAKAFQGIYAIDRPARAFVMAAAYSLFGINPLYYNISAYLFRVLGAIAFLWSLRMLFPRQRLDMMIAAILFLIYPGFVSSPNAIDYQSQQIGLFLAYFSIGLGVKAVFCTRPIYRRALWAASILLTWAYLGLVEYFFGLEFLRFAIFALLAGRAADRKVWTFIKETFLRWLPFSIGSLGFILWRFFIFESERKATDLGAQLKIFSASPLLVGVDWATNLLKDVFEVLILSWSIPLINVWNISLRLREQFFGAILILLSALIILALFWFEHEKETDEKNQGNWQAEAFWLGFTSAVAGFIPVILSNRNADFYGLSRYMLASSSGAALVVTVFIHQLRSPKFRYLFLCVMVGTSVLTHYLNGIQWARSSQAMQNFWWQVAWRIPQIKAGTALVANYSHSAIEEDYFIWGPANLIYQPQSADLEKNHPAIWGIVLTRENAAAIASKSAPVAINRRSILTYMDYRNTLILTQPTSASCVQVIDGAAPVTSDLEQYDIQLIANQSDQNNILINTQAPPPLPAVFGTEPAHGWCYFYQKAGLAYQRGDWQLVLDYAKKAKTQGVSAGDPVEWMPFVQAAMFLNERETVLEIAPKIKKSPVLTRQACQVFTELPNLEDSTREFSRQLFCPGSK